MQQRTEATALAAEAGRAAREGRWHEAEALWRRLQAADPANLEAAFSLGVHALQRGSFAEALAQFETAHRGDPANPAIATMVAEAARGAGDVEREGAALAAALAADPYYWPALLKTAELQERRGRPKAAAATYRNVLKIAPRDAAQWPPDLRPLLEHARARVAAHEAAFAAHLETATGAFRTGLAPALQARWAEAISIMAGRTRPYVSDSNQLAVPRLPAVPFHDRAHFPWIEALEGRTEAIRAEFLALQTEAAPDFVPYVQYQPGQPVNQWGALNHSQRWSTFHLWRNGAPVAENLARCPETAAALQTVEMADIAGLCPNAMFSVLAPKTEIPPHHGETNARLVAHLALVVPPGCRYRVGFDERDWREGEAFVFDDTIEHAARNDGESPRAVLIFDVWNPFLSVAERDMVRRMTEAARTFAAEG